MTMQSEIKKHISELEKTVKVRFPGLYVDFLAKIPKDEIYEIDNTGICFYSYSDLTERNETYEIKEYDSNYFLIGQEGDKGFFINTKDSGDETIYSNGLGAIGSLTMKREADNIFELETRLLDGKDTD